MRINYNFPYYQERLSPRQKARLAAESSQNQPVIRMEGRTLTILRVRTSTQPRPKSENKAEISQGGIEKN